jgi:hypothetical protein
MDNKNRCFEYTLFSALKDKKLIHIILEDEATPTPVLH